MEFSKPGPSKRVCAYFIDLIIIHLCAVAISYNLLRDVFSLVWLAGLLFKDCIHGQSIGKKLVGIQVVDESCLPAKPLKTIIRNFFMIIPIFPLIEYVRMLRDKEQGRRIGDHVAKTKVHDLRPMILDRTFFWISITLTLVIVLIAIVEVYIISKQTSQWYEEGMRRHRAVKSEGFKA